MRKCSTKQKIDLFIKLSKKMQIMPILLRFYSLPFDNVYERCIGWNISTKYISHSVASQIFNPLLNPIGIKCGVRRMEFLCNVCFWFVYRMGNSLFQPYNISYPNNFLSKFDINLCSYAGWRLQNVNTTTLIRICSAQV